MKSAKKKGKKEEGGTRKFTGEDLDSLNHSFPRVGGGGGGGEAGRRQRKLGGRERRRFLADQ